MGDLGAMTFAGKLSPAQLAHVATVLADSKVNILALLGSTSGTQGSAQVVVDNDRIGTSRYKGLLT
jgi:hypothetical protein